MIMNKKIGMGFFGELDLYLFGEGRHYRLYEKMGAHPFTYRRQTGIHFAVWAPHAEEVSVVGDFNGWNPGKTPMKRISGSGIFEAFVPGLKEGELYKYAISTKSSSLLMKADPFAFYSEYRPGTASVTADISGFSWSDSAWMEKRRNQDPVKAPIAVYEVHLGLSLIHI